MTKSRASEPSGDRSSSFRDKFGYDRSDMETFNGLRVHPRSACEGRSDIGCPIHSPSDHHMKDWPLHWRTDRGIMERIDPRTGIGHPDPDDVAYHMSKFPNDKYYSVHGCDGACLTENGDSDNGISL